MCQSGMLPRFGHCLGRFAFKIPTGGQEFSKCQDLADLPPWPLPLWSSPWPPFRLEPWKHPLVFSIIFQDFQGLEHHFQSYLLEIISPMFGWCYWCSSRTFTENPVFSAFVRFQTMTLWWKIQESTLGWDFEDLLAACDARVSAGSNLDDWNCDFPR